MHEYLKNLPLTDAQKQLATQEYENAPTFYMFCKATPQLVKDYLGLDDLSALEKALWDLMTDDERTAVQAELDQLK